MGSYLYALIIYPIELFIETVFSISMEMVPSAGYAIVFVSLAVQLLVLPLYKRADELQEEERARQREMAPAVKHIKKTFKGDERVMMLSMYYRFENYHTYHQLKGILPLLLQIPFFMAAYNFLSGCSALEGASFYFLKDMGRPDGMLTIGGIAINVMPILMTLINVISGAIYTRGLELKDKLQLYITAGIFLVILYDSPSGLVFYWTLNNVFSLLKNIFMKLVKHPRKIASVASILFAVAYSYKCIARGAADTSSGRIVIAIILVASSVPAVGLLIDKIKSDKKDHEEHQISNCRSIFRIAGVIAAITTGVVIPTVTIASSPTEFVIRGHYVNPLHHVIFCFVVAVGLFIIWGNIIYEFYSEKAKRILSFILFTVVISGLVNYQFFRKNLNNMSLYMTYKFEFDYSVKDILINLLILGIVGIGCFVIYRYSKKAVLMVLYAAVGTVVIMSCYSIYTVQHKLGLSPQIMDDEYYTDGTASFQLDKSGQNVVLIMLDRSFGPYVPYIFHEKPELVDKYSGFTYYPNTISHGIRTLVGAPALFGGYDYTAYEIKDKVGEEYYDYIHDSLKVLPKLFSENGYKCTVFDPPSLIDVGDSGINGKTLEEWYHDIDPSIDAYYADGVIKTKEEALRDYEFLEKNAKNNYIRHSIFISSPLFIRKLLYDDGKYLTQNKVDYSRSFIGHYEELNKLPEMTKISDSGMNTLTIIENDATHCEGIRLQMPDYTVEEDVDNSGFLDQWRAELNETPGAREIGMYADLQITSYGTNMAALLSIGEWIDYLKKNDLYDNTRIIIVGDHGFFYFVFADMLFEKNGESTDLEAVTPLLLVKDFGDGEFTTSNEFMTNADVPSIALRGIIDDPVNPYTGNPIDDVSKKKEKQYVFDNTRWLTVHDDIYDLNNWDVEDIEFKNKVIIELPHDQ